MLDPTTVRIATDTATRADDPRRADPSQESRNPQDASDPERPEFDDRGQTREKIDPAPGDQVSLAIFGTREGDQEIHEEDAAEGGVQIQEYAHDLG